MTEYMTRTEVAALLRVTTRTITEYVRTGRLPCPARLGRRSLWTREEILGALSRSRDPRRAASAASSQPRCGRPRKAV